VNALRIACSIGLLVVYATVAQGDGSAAPIDWARAQRVDLQMVDYAFVPDQLRFRHGVP
jgi:hypothetical protein